jgi:hypothetical protein
VEEPAKEPEAPKEEVAAAPAAEPFKFTEGSDDDTFTKERDAYLETVEITPELQTILERQNAQITALAAKTAENPAVAAAEPDEFAVKATAALNKLVEFRQAEDGTVIPDTTALVDLLRNDFKQEMSQVVFDLNAQESLKYKGLTVFQEFLKDGAGLDDRGVANLETFLASGGKIATPSYVPEGIDAKFAEAFWQHPDRDDLTRLMGEAKEVITSPLATEDDKNEARRLVNAANQSLQMIQRGLDADKADRTRTEAAITQERQAVAAKADQSYLQTGVEMLRTFSEGLAPKLTIFDEKGAGVTALAYAALVEKALTDDEWAKYAQEDLKKQGVDFDWKKGRTLLDDLYRVEHKIAALEAKPGTNPRAIALARQEKSNALKAIKLEQTDLMGRITKIAIAGAGKRLEQEIQKAPKLSAVKPKAPGGSPVDNKGDEIENMSADEIRSRLGQLKHELRTKGYQAV